MNERKSKWQILEEAYYEKFRIFSIKKSKRVNPRTGVASDFLLMEGLDWVNVIPTTKDGQVVLVRQYRHGSEEYTLEIPGGCVEQGEEPGISASRELLEETGYSSSSLELLGTIHPNPALQSMRCHCFLALNCVKTGEQTLDPGEDISVEVYTLKAAERLLREGTITHALVAAAFGLYFLKTRTTLSSRPDPST